MITLKTLTKEIATGIIEIQVKNGKRIEAKIYPPNKYHKDFQIENFAGIARYRNTLEDALEMVRGNLEDRMNAFALRDQSFKVVLEKK